MRDRRNSGTRDERRLEGSFGAGGASRRSASLPPSVSPAPYGRGPRGKRKRRRRRFSPSCESTRRDATTSDRPSVESFSPRPHVDRNTRSPTRFSHPVVVVRGSLFFRLLSLNLVRHTKGRPRPTASNNRESSLFALLLPPSSFHPLSVSRPTRANYPITLFVQPPSWDASRSFLR